jgi:putative endonuclease
MPYVYIIFSKKINKYYVGACTNLERRLYEHNIGHSKFTSTGMPWELMHSEQYETLAEARKIELSIKKMKSRKFIEELIAKGRASRPDINRD